MQLAKILNGIKQTRPRAIVYDNYDIFSLDTLYGNLLAVYDNLLSKWVALDILTGLGAVKQFFTLETVTETRLYAITELNKLFELYQTRVDDPEAPQLYTRSFIAQQEDGRINVTATQKGEKLDLYFQGGDEDSTVSILELVDGKKSQRTVLDMTRNVASLQFPFIFPIIFSTSSTAKPTTFNLRQGKRGTKLAYVIQWGNNAELVAFSLQTSDELPPINKEQKEMIYARTNS